MSQNRLIRRRVLCALPVLCLPLWAQAAIAPNTLPGNGVVQSGQVTGSVSDNTLNLMVGSSPAVVNWGVTGGAVLNPVSGVGGFDVGSQASVVFTGAGSSSPSAVLNIDVSGQLSELDGTMFGNNVSVYVANANGIFVGSGAVVSAPTVAFLANSPATAQTLFDEGTFSAGGVATGALSLASTAQVNAGDVILAGNGAVNIGNTITANAIDLYGEANITGGLNADTVQVTGGFYSTGTITANQLDVNLTGYVNDVKTGQILANNFTLDAGSSGTMNIGLTADGSQAQGFNVFVNGNADIDSGNTTVSTGAPNQNSKLIVIASGNLTVSPGTVTNPYGLNPAFQFPGLLYLEGNQNLTVNADLVNAYSTAAPVGYGVFAISPNIIDNYSVYANGSRGVNFEGLWNGSGYNAANSINGQNPSTTTFTFTVPIYFLSSNNGAVAPVQASQIQNGNTGYMQPNNVFFGNVPDLTAQSAAPGVVGGTSNLEQMVLQDAITDTSDGALTVNSPQFQAGFPAVQAGVEVLGGYGIYPGNPFYNTYVAILVDTVVQGYETGNTGSNLNNIAVATAQQLGMDYLQAVAS
jgi:cytoskeletal protein CcmA (bactofilin family)